MGFRMALAAGMVFSLILIGCINQAPPEGAHSPQINESRGGETPQPPEKEMPENEQPAAQNGRQAMQNETAQAAPEEIPADAAPTPAMKNVSELLFDASVHEFNKDYVSAIIAYGDAIALQPRNEMLYVLRANAYTKYNDSFHAKIDLGEALKIDRKNYEVYVGYGHANSVANKANSSELLGFAISNYTKAIELNRSDRSTYVGRGFAYLKKGDYQMASTDLPAGTIYGTKWQPVILQELYRYVQSKGPFYNGMGYYSRQLENSINFSMLVPPARTAGLPVLQPTDIGAYRRGAQEAENFTRIGDAYFYNSNWTQASYFYKQAEIADSFRVQPYGKRALALMMAGEDTLAHAELAVAQRIGPEDEWVALASAHYYAKKHEYGQELAYANTLVSKEPQNTLYLAIKSHAHAQLGEDAMAIKAGEKLAAALSASGFPA